MNNLPISITCNRKFPKVKPILEKHWHILQVNAEYSNIFHESSIIAFRRNKNIKQILAISIIENNEKLNNRPNDK